MIGIDTNILLRLFIEDNPQQCERARRLVRSATQKSPVYVNAVVLSELAWTTARKMKISKPRIVEILGEILSVDDLEIAHLDAARAALKAYATGKADYPDYYLAMINKERGCNSTATFDVDALDLPEFSGVP